MDHLLLLREPLERLVQQICDTAGATSDDPLVLLLDELVYAQDWDL